LSYVRVFSTQCSEIWGAAAIIGGVIGDKINRDHYKGNFENTPVLIATSNPDFHVPVEKSICDNKYSEGDGS
jgi:hypothetical protein